MKLYVIPTLIGWQVVQQGHRRGLTYGSKWSAGRGAKRKIRKYETRGEVVYLNTANKVTRIERVAS